MTGTNIDRCQYWQMSRITKKFVAIEFRTFDLCKLPSFIKTEAHATIVTIEFTTLHNYGLEDHRCQYWEVWNFRGVENHERLLSLLNSSPSHCVEFEISSKLKHLSFFVQNYGLKDNRYQYWQVSRITENYCHQWIQYLQIVHYAKIFGKWLTSLPVPHFKDNEKTAPF